MMYGWNQNWRSRLRSITSIHVAASCSAKNPFWLSGGFWLLRCVSLLKAITTNGPAGSKLTAPPDGLLKRSSHTFCSALRSPGTTNPK